MSQELPPVKMVLNPRESEQYRVDSAYRTHKRKVADDYAMASEQSVDLFMDDELEAVYQVTFTPKKPKV